MTFALIAAGAILGTVGQPSDPTIKVGIRDRAFHWMLVPGGGVFAVPTPYMVLVPVGRLEVPLPAKTRQELHIVIQSEKDGVITERFAKKIVEGLQQMIEDAQEAEAAAASIATTKSIDCKQSDPKQVIDPIVTGF